MYFVKGESFVALTLMSPGLISLTIGFIFCNKLYKLMILQRSSSPVSQCFKKTTARNINRINHKKSSNNHDKSSIVINDREILNQRQQQLMETITRQCVLLLMESMVTISMIIVLIASIDPLNSQKQDEKIFNVIENGYLTLFSFHTALYIWLSFGFAKKQYYFLCYPVHNCCIMLFQWITVNNIKRSFANSQLQVEAKEALLNELQTLDSGDD